MKFFIRLLAIPLLMVLGVCLVMAFVSKPRQPKMKYLPEDMVLIQGKEPFYISTHLTTNKEYMTYLLWLINVYVDYPNIAFTSLPDSNRWKSDKFNDPYVQSYLFHPAYEEYPVLGVSWIQADRFCRWKTDRLNEFILVNEKYFRGIQSWQVNENNFNTEAWLCYQYGEPDLKQVYPKPFPFSPPVSRFIHVYPYEYNLPDSVRNLIAQLSHRCITGKNVRLSNPAITHIFPHFRIPTEMELDLYYQKSVTETQQSSGFVSWFYKNTVYAKKPNALYYGGEADNGAIFYGSRDVNKIDTLFTPYFQKTPTNLAVYPRLTYEWAFDAYSEKKCQLDLLSAYEIGRQRQGGLWVNGDYPELTEKDSLGHMQYFYILKNDTSGYAIPVENYQPKGIFMKRVIRTKELRTEAKEQFGYGNVGFRVAMCAD